MPALLRDPTRKSRRGRRVASSGKRLAAAPDDQSGLEGGAGGWSAGRKSVLTAASWQGFSQRSQSARDQGRRSFKQRKGVERRSRFTAGQAPCPDQVGRERGDATVMLTVDRPFPPGQLHLPSQLLTMVHRFARVQQEDHREVRRGGGQGEACHCVRQKSRAGRQAGAGC